MSSKKNTPTGGMSILTAFLDLETLLKKYLRRYLTRQQDIDDVVQDIFVRAYQAEQTRKIRSPRSYLFKIAKHMALNESKRRSRQLMVYMGDMADLDVIDSKVYGDEALALEQRLTALNRLIADLPPQCQRVLVLRKIYGYSHKEVADRLNISVKTVEKHLTKGLQRCQESETRSAGNTNEQLSDVSVNEGNSKRAATMRGVDE